MDDTDQIIQQFFTVLPDDIRKFVSDGSWKNTIADLSRERSLSEEQQSTIRIKTLLALVGMESPKTLAADIQKGTEISMVGADDIVKEIKKAAPEDIFDYGEAMVEAIDNFEPKPETETKAAPELIPPSVPTPIPSRQPRPAVNVKNFVDIPAYGIERPASSFTSVLPRATMNVKDTTDTIAEKADDLMQWQNKPTDGSASALAGPTGVPIKSSMPVSAGTPLSSNLPMVETEIPSIQLAKLSKPTNIPRQETKTTNVVPSTPSTAPAAAPIVAPTVPVAPAERSSLQEKVNSLNSRNGLNELNALKIPNPPEKPKTPPKPAAPFYAAGQDPYREPPTS